MELAVDVPGFVALRNCFFRRQESVDLLLGVNRPVVDEDGNILSEFIQEPLDLDLWATRLSQPQLLKQDQQREEGEGGQTAAEAMATGARGGGGGGGRGAASVFSSPAAVSFLARPLSGEGGVETSTTITTAAAAAAAYVGPEEAEAIAGGDDAHCCNRRRRNVRHPSDEGKGREAKERRPIRISARRGVENTPGPLQPAPSSTKE